MDKLKRLFFWGLAILLPNEIANSNDLTGWVLYGTPTPTTVAGLDAAHTGTQITDDDASVDEYVELDTVYAAPLSPLVYRFFAEKEASVTASSNFGFGFTNGGAYEETDVSINLQAGTLLVGSDDTGTLAYQITTAAYNSDYWEILLSVTPQDALNKELDLWLDPSYYDLDTTTGDAANTGTMTIGNVELYFNATIVDIVGKPPVFT